MCLRTCFFNSCCWGKSVCFVSCAAANMWVTKNQTFYCSLQWFLQCPAHWTEKHEVHVLFLPEFHCLQVWSTLSSHIKPVLTTHSSLLTTHYSLLPLHICAPLITHHWKLPNAQMCELLNSQRFLWAAPLLGLCSVSILATLLWKQFLTLPIGFSTEAFNLGYDFI